MTTLEAIIQQAEQLPVDEQRQLLAHLTERLQQHELTTRPQRHTWSSLRGLVAYQFLGEDAQVWVSRSRQESERGMG